MTMAARGKKKPSRGGGPSSLSSAAAAMAETATATAAEVEKMEEKKKKNGNDDANDDDAKSSSSASVYDSADEVGGPPGYGLLAPSSGEEDDDGDDDDESEYDSAASDDDDDDDDDDEEEDDEEEDSDGEGFEDRGSSDEEDIEDDDDGDDDDDDSVEILDDDGNIFDSTPRTWRESLSRAERGKRAAGGIIKKKATGGGDGDDGGSGGDDGDGKGGAEAKGASASASAKNTDDGNTHDPAAAMYMHTDDLSSDDDDPAGLQNRIGRVPLHWYDEYDHIGYDAHGTKVIKTAGAAAGEDRIDIALRNEDDMMEGDGKEGGMKKFTVHDALNGRDVVLTPRQVEMIRRVQAGAYAHPEHEAEPDYVDYYSSVKEISGLNSGAHEPKARFQPSKYEKLAVRRLLHRLKCGSVSMAYLEGRVRDMNDVESGKKGRGKGKKGDKQEGDTDRPFLLWKGDEEDELALRKGPQHIPPPKLPPPGHAESYIPPDEYLPTEADIEGWSELDPKDRPYGLLVPKKFPNLRSVGAYEHAVRERFERCLDLYMCPRQLKRRLNIDPESLVPSLPKARDLRPFPTSRAVEYVTPFNEEDDGPPMVRCLTVSPDGQFLASGAEDGYVRVWEVQTGRLLRSWDVSDLAGIAEGGEDEEEVENEADADGEARQEKAKKEQDGEEGGRAAAGGEEGGPSSSSTKTRAAPKPVVALEWNPNRSHHVLLAACGKCAFVIATGTAGPDDAESTDALLHSARKDEGVVRSEKAAKAVGWMSARKLSAMRRGKGKERGKEERAKAKKKERPLSAYGGRSGPICALRTAETVASVRWHRKGDYFVTVSPKAGAAAVLIHQLSKSSSQRPFSKFKKGGGDVQTAAFHPTKPFLFVATPRHVRVYHLVKQMLVKRLLTGCRWVSTLDVHPTGDHVLVGSLDRRVVWFDLDLGATPYKTLKYHSRAVRSASYHPRYPLMASSSDDGTVHVFHSTVYSDLMRNPLVVPVKILRGGHKVTEGGKLGVLDFVWHPSQPWLFSCGADGKIILYQDI